MPKISYDDKTNTKPTSNRKTQATAEDFNEIKNSVNALYDTKQDSEIGKGLSTNDFTNDNKTKLDGIEENAEKKMFKPTGNNRLIKNINIFKSLIKYY